MRRSARKLCYEKRDKKAALKSQKKLCACMDRPMKSSQIGFDPTVQQQKSLAVRISKLHNITELQIHTHPFDDENARFCDLGVCTVCKSSPKSKPHFTTRSIRKGHSLNAVISSSAATLLSPSGALYNLIKYSLYGLIMLEQVCLKPLCNAMGAMICSL